MAVAPQSFFQQILMGVAAFLTMIGCGLGNTITEFLSPSIGEVDNGGSVTLTAEEAVGNFLNDLVAGNYLGASQYLCEEAQTRFFETDPENNALLGADISDLEIDITYGASGNDAFLKLSGEVTFVPGTSNEVTAPAEFLPFDENDLRLEDGKWLLCPSIYTY